MRIIKNFAKTKHPDYYRKKYWDGSFAKERGQILGMDDEVFTSTQVHDDHATIIITNSGISLHTDWEATTYLIILHNQSYQFNYQKTLHPIPTGSLLIFDLMTEHGIDKVCKGSNLFMALCFDSSNEFGATKIKQPRQYLLDILPTL